MKTGKFFKITMTFVLVLTMVISVALYGCGGTGGTAGDKSAVTESTQGGSVSTDTATEKLPPLKVAYFGWNQGNPVPEKDAEVTKFLEEKLNVDFEIVGQSGADQLTEKLNIMLAANEMPDVFPTWWNETLMTKACASFSDEELAQYMPKTFASVNNLAKMIGYNPQQLWERYKRNGANVQLPNAWYGGQYVTGVLWRKDILDELGKQVPSTLQEWEDVFNAYKQKYPDKYAYTADMKDFPWQSFSAVTGASGISYFQNQMKDGKIVQGWVQPEMKPILETLNKWYKAGYIDKEFVTKDQAAKRNDFINGKTICQDWIYDTDTITEAPYFAGNIEEATVAIVPGAKFVLGPFASLDATKKSAFQSGDPFHGGAYGFGIQNEADKDRLHRLMTFMEELTQDKDTFVSANYGIKGKHWDYDSDGFPICKPGFTTAAERAPTGAGYYWISCYSTSEFFAEEIFVPMVLKKSLEAINGPGGICGPEKCLKVLSVEKGPITSPDGTDLKEVKYKDLIGKNATVFAQIITGAKPGSIFDDYAKEWNDTAATEFNEALDRLYLKYWKK